MAIFLITATPSDTSSQAVLQAFHILNQFDIPVGIAREVEGGITYTDYTLVTCVRDPQTLKYYIRTYDDQTIHMVDLTQFDLNAKTAKRLDTSMFQQPVVDISKQLQ